jgi:histidyl-tRNA synthetase
VELPEIHAVRGTRDVLPPARAAERALELQLEAVLGRYGYELIDTPIVEPTELFLRKSGEAYVARMYAFTHWNRDLCLRPEFTASVIRAFVNHLQDWPLPVRVQYSGPTFRYEKPGQLRHRQFTEVGAECIGGAGPAADGEMLALARDGLEAAGVGAFQFRVGHLGAVLSLLGQMGMDTRAQGLIVNEMERLSGAPGDAAEIVERLAALLAAEGDLDTTRDGALADLLQSSESGAAEEIAESLFERANLSLDGGARKPEEIVARLLKKTRRPNPLPALRRAVDFICALRSQAGPPGEALPALRSLLREFDLEDRPVREVEHALECFAAHFETPADVIVDLSLARGLRYYTGLIFEVFDDEGNQLAGGGRYDDLVRSLGGRSPVPACGFSFGLERVLAASARRSGSTSTPRMARVLIAPVEEADYDAAARVAGALRRSGIAVELDVRYRGVKGNLRHADREGIPVLLIVGERERAEEGVRLHQMDQFAERFVPMDAIVAEVTRAVEVH